MSDGPKITAALENDYDVVSVALGREEIRALQIREGLVKNEPSDLECVYMHFLGQIGEVEMPAPAFTVLVDTCAEKNITVEPLDMDEASYTKEYCDRVKAWDFFKETRVLKKMMKKGFDLSSASTFIVQWDASLNTIKGYRAMSELRERFIASRIKDLSKDARKMLVIVEEERLPGIIRSLEASA